MTAHAQDYGSIAYSPSTKVVAAALAGSKESVADAAVQQCRAQGGADDCWALNWFYKAVGAFARSSNGDYGSGYGWGDTVGVATDFANKYAIQTCQEYGGQDCLVILVKATSAVSSSGTGGALTQPPTPPVPVPAPTPSGTSPSVMLTPTQQKQLRDLIDSANKARKAVSCMIYVGKQIGYPLVWLAGLYLAPQVVTNWPSPGMPQPYLGQCDIVDEENIPDRKNLKTVKPSFIPTPVPTPTP